MSHIEFETGQNATYLNHLQNVIKNFSPSERACVLMWDETQIRKSVHYNEGKDCIEGTVNHGDGIYYRDIANKALVFMVRSITKSWKQSVAYYLSEGELPAEKLKDLIVGVIVSLQEIGLDVRASVSDQGGNNRAAIRCLRKQFTPDANRKKRLPLCSRQNAIQPASVLHYRVNSSTNIYHLWDVPHLLKSVRNNFQQHNVHFGNNKVARWHHLIKLKEQDGIGGTSFQITLKLTDQHLKLVRNKDKMKASPAEAAEDAASKSIEEEVSPEDEHELKCLTRNLPSSIVKMEQEEPIDLFDVIFPKEPSVQDFITPDRIPPLSPDPRRDKRINAKKTEQQIVTERIADGQRAVQRENEDQPGDDHDLVVALEHDDKQRLTYACQAVID
ncbi:DNA transposase [Frankliniella fusca]|uniref:DNA transposase n=1 Tax=Frankliniella fusca TaxID=407009 RepID=A0AAE1HMW4_9NEOP|nr:DNA transposase [Frankliniella fusca]